MKLKSIFLLSAALVVVAGTVSCTDDYYDEDAYLELIASAFPVSDVDQSHDWSTTNTITADIDLSDYDSDTYKVKIFSGNPYSSSSYLYTSLTVEESGTAKFSVPNTQSDLYYVVVDGSKGRIISRYYEADGTTLSVSKKATRSTRSSYLTRSECSTYQGDSALLGDTYPYIRSSELSSIYYQGYTRTLEKWIEEVTELYNTSGVSAFSNYGACPFETSSIIKSSEDATVTYDTTYTYTYSQGEATTTTTSIDLSNLSCGWGNGGSYDSSTYTATFGAAWDGCSYWLGQYTDWSDYDALTINWDSSTADAITINLVIQDSEYTATAATDYYDAQKYSTITLTFSDYSSFTFNSISQWWVGSSAAGSVTFTDAYLSSTTYTTVVDTVMTITENSSSTYLDFSDYVLKSDATATYSTFQPKLVMLENVDTTAALPWIMCDGWYLYGPYGFFAEGVEYFSDQKLALMKAMSSDGKYDDILDKVEQGFSITTSGGEVEVPFIYGATNYSDRFGYIYYKDGDDPLTKPHYILMKDGKPQSNIYYYAYGGTSVGSGMALANWPSDTTQNWGYKALWGLTDSVEVYGTTYKLVYFGADYSNTYGTYTFPSGYNILFFIAPYQEGSLTYEYSKFNYSIPEYNARIIDYDTATGHLDTNSDCPNYDPTRGLVSATAWEYNGYTYFGFGDGSGDEDLNDIVFCALGDYETDVELVQVPGDTTTTTTAELVEYTFCYEDNFPEAGDYDFNDCVMSIQFDTDDSGTNDVINLTVNLKAVGATEQIAAALRFNGISASQISSISIESQEFSSNANTRYSGYVPTQEPSPTTIYTMTGGTDAYMVLFNDAHYAISGVDQDEAYVNNGGSRMMYNTLQDKTNTRGDTVSVKTNTYKITLNGKYSGLSELTAEDLDLFIIEQFNGAYFEVHTYPYKTNEVVHEWGGSNYDDVYPWAIMVAGDFKYPIEWTPIAQKEGSVTINSSSTAYPKFANWAQDHTTDTDWYEYPTSGYVYE